MSTFRLTDKQTEANALLAGPARHILLRGGARSGKTFTLCRAVIIRAIKAPGSTHVILRFRFNHLKASVIFDTIPKVFELCYPQLSYKLNKTDWVLELPNSSKILFGGLDDKERTEKILGQEHCVDPDSLVLTSDLRWVPAKTLAQGDELVGFPEDLDGHQTLQRSTVERSDIIKAVKYRVVTDKGETIVSERHKFVAHYDDRRTRNFRSLSWRMATQIGHGDKIRFAGTPWPSSDTREDGWLAGILDGEGWVAGAICGIAQNEGPILDRIRKRFADYGIDHCMFKQHGTGTKCWSLRPKGLWASLRLLGMARPYRLLPKAAHLWEGTRGFNKKSGAEHVATVLRVERLGVGDVVALGTSTKTFIADGFLGHNSTIYLNECSQISYDARNKAMTRLAQKSGLALKAYYDCNPPTVGHWTYRLFEKRIEPKSGAALDHPENYVTMMLNPGDNLNNLPEEYLEELNALPERDKARFLRGQYLSQVEGALWQIDDFKRVAKGHHPEFQRVVVAIDPSGCRGPEDDRSDEVGIVCAAIGRDKCGYILEDASGRYSPDKWAKVALNLYDKHKADRIIAERNFGGAMVLNTIYTARPDASVSEITASRGKAVRAEPIAALYEQGKVFHVGEAFVDLEEQFCNFSTSGYQGAKSPDRADAAIWALSELMVTGSNYVDDASWVS